MSSVEEEVVSSDEEEAANAKAAARKAEIERDVENVNRFLSTLRFLISARVIFEISSPERACYFTQGALIKSSRWKEEREQLADNLAYEITPEVFRYVVTHAAELVQGKSMYVQSRVMEKIPERIQRVVRGITRQTMGALDYEQ